MKIKKKEKEEMQDLHTARLLYPTVTEIIGKQTEKEMRNIPVDILVNASIRGTKLHEYCTLYLQVGFVPEIEEEYKPYFDAFVKWADENIEKTLYSETRLYDDEMRFSGKFDLIVNMKNGNKVNVLLDTKFTATTSSSWPIQLAAYEHLCKLNGIDIQKVYNLHLKKTKSALFDMEKKIVHPAIVKANLIGYENTTPYWEIFTSTLTCFDYFDRKELPDVCI